MIKLLFLIVLSGFITFMLLISGSVKHNRRFYDFSDGPQIIIENPWGSLILFSLIFLYFYKKEFIDTRPGKQHTSGTRRKPTKGDQENIDEKELKKANENYNEEITIWETEEPEQADNIRKILEENGLYAVVRCSPGILGMPQYCLMVLKQDRQQVLEIIIALDKKNKREIIKTREEQRKDQRGKEKGDRK